MVDFSTSEHWQDWITVFGYVTFTAFILWRVLIPR